ncbi:hypothetical protein AWL63_10570 [Sphingomonas panacis]|uniref:Uncharacterized protein n=1 Tax=Sphingomonas panacis TaxID=1560345 RepID=A0A1B3ZA84_9SPHN|nr:hypothetical protein [Sphingomonas panacis]AOH84344.1 hypothetical protein AWL63_10570 [Sphingomonas panacis]
MDINYLLGREQVSLHNALVARSAPARIAHEGLAIAYGKLLSATTFPHRRMPGSEALSAPAQESGCWEDDGGTAS